MRTKLLIAAAGLTGWVAFAPPARAQFYGWGYYRPYYPVPYGYYPQPYYAPPYYAPRHYGPGPVYEAPPRRRTRRPVVIAIRHKLRWTRHRPTSRPLINPLLGPLR